MVEEGELGRIVEGEARVVEDELGVLGEEDAEGACDGEAGGQSGMPRGGLQ